MESIKTFVKSNLHYFAIPLAFLFAVWLSFLLLIFLERPVTFESKRKPVVYTSLETEKTLTELKEKGYTRNIGPYFEQLVKSLKSKQLGILKYKLRANDNLWTLARHYKISIDTIVGANPYLLSLTKTKLGQEIVIISKKGVLHTVREKEGLKSIAQSYGLDQAIILAANDIKDGLFSGVKTGDVLFIPGAVPQDLTPEMRLQYDLIKLFGSPIWSGKGKYTSPMRIRSDPFTGAKSFHDGLDIAVSPSDKICSVADGIVIFSGEYGGFGNMVKIKHDNGYTTLYGHNSKLFVRNGQKLKKGHIVAQAGSTGRSTGTHLHFTVWDKNGKLVDPTLMLMSTK